MISEKYEKKNLSEIVVDYIADRIFSREYKPGDRIIELDIATKLNISRAPVREGIVELQSEGLIKFVPRKGNFVTKMTPEDVKEVFDIRLLLENSIIEILINEKKLDEKDFESLKKIVDDMIKVSRSDKSNNEKILELNKRDIEFHRYLWVKSNSHRRVKILTDLFNQLKLAMVIDTEQTGNLDVTSSDHYFIIEYLKEGSIEKCKEALRDHIISFSSKSKESIGIY